MSSGFHPSEYNCIGLADFDGVLVDGDPLIVDLAHELLRGKLRVQQCFITVENCHTLLDGFSELGVLSIDVDGNDYWFLEKLIRAQPAVIAVE